MSGVSSFSFWFANFVFDLAYHLLVCLFIFAVFAAFDWNHVYIGHSNTAIGLFLMLFFFGFASIPLAYIFSHIIKKPSTGFAILTIVFIISGLLLATAMGI